MKIGRMEIKIYIHPKKDPKALEKLFEMVDRLPKMTKEEYEKWIEQE